MSTAKAKKGGVRDGMESQSKANIPVSVSQQFN